MKVSICTVDMISVPEASGQAWIYLNWALGIQANGVDVLLLVQLPDSEEPAEIVRRIRFLRGQIDEVGLRAGISLLLSDPDRVRLKPVESELSRITVDWREAAAQSDLLFNFRYGLSEEVVRSFRRSAALDTDPGLAQIWISNGELQFARHDAYFTIGETVGTSSARFTDLGLRWQHTRPPVYLQAWPVVGSDTGAPYTTISNWWGEELKVDGCYLDNSKRKSFLSCADLPEHVTAPLELALCLARDSGHDAEDRSLLESKGWRIRHAWDITASFSAYRRYIQSARGEFSCAKPCYSVLSTAWISDRTVCFLASGKPAIVQDTGPSSYLPDEAGLFRFQDMPQAARAIDKAESQYERHCLEARALAEEHFDAVKVTRKFLEGAID